MNYENRLDYFENNYEIIFGANFNETLLNRPEYFGDSLS